MRADIKGAALAAPASADSDLAAASISKVETAAHTLATPISKFGEHASDLPIAKSVGNQSVAAGNCLGFQDRAEFAGLCQKADWMTPAPQTHMDLSLAASDVLFERQRQVSSEGWTAEHDDAHASEELATAASCYLRPDLRTVTVSADRVTFGDPWPWWNEWNDGGRCAGREKAWWKPTDRRRDLVKAAALIVAEIERLDRAATTEGQP